MIRTILVPLDGSTPAERALPEACRLAREEQAAVVLVRVAHAAFPHADLFAQEAAVTEAESYLRTVQQSLVDGGIVARTDVFVSDPAEAINLAALVHGADVIVMATHGRSGLGRVVPGSVAERVVQEAGVPVLLVRADGKDNPVAAAPAGAYRKVLVPLDGTEAAEEAVRYIAQQAVTRDAEVLLVHSEQAASLPVGPGVWGYVSAQGLEQAEEETRRRCAETHAYLEEIARLYLGGRTTEIYVTVGDPGEAILHIAHEQGADAIVMPTHARHGLDYVIHGSVARYVLHHARVPLLVLHRSDATAPAPWTVQPEPVAASGR